MVMTGKWDGRPRRKNDFDENGKIKEAVILARIDERVNVLISNALEVKKELTNHKKDDEDRFSAIDKTIWRTGGIVTGAMAVIVFVFDWIFRK